jgi:hypothetical protein
MGKERRKETLSWGFRFAQHLPPCANNKQAQYVESQKLREEKEKAEKAIKKQQHDDRLANRASLHPKKSQTTTSPTKNKPAPGDY